jgi:starvation-inducible DNA-binding protein
MNKLSAKDQELLDALRKNVANIAVFYHESHGFHWNLVGPDFQEYHALFETIYSDVYDSLDPMAENCRKAGGLAPYTLKEFLELTSLKESEIKKFDAKTLTKRLYTDNKDVITDLINLFILANEQNEQGIANFVAERIDMHQKWNWQLGASLGKTDATEG